MGPSELRSGRLNAHSGCEHVLSYECERGGICVDRHTCVEAGGQLFSSSGAMRLGFETGSLTGLVFVQ